jgi:hypothetical protein
MHVIGRIDSEDNLASKQFFFPLLTKVVHDGLYQEYVPSAPINANHDTGSKRRGDHHSSG